MSNLDYNLIFYQGSPCIYYKYTTQVSHKMGCQNGQVINLQNGSGGPTWRSHPDTVKWKNSLGENFYQLMMDDNAVLLHEIIRKSQRS